MALLRSDVTLDDVRAVYDGPGGRLWELLMGEQIHVNGEADTVLLAERAGIGAGSTVLDVCSALGGPARSLARRYGCRVMGLDATRRMVEEAGRRTASVRRTAEVPQTAGAPRTARAPQTAEADLADRVTFTWGDALAMPFGAASFDVVLGQDAWCYVTDKARLIAECARVVRPGGTLAFTDWLETEPTPEAEWRALHDFMVFPYMETPDGYVALLRAAGLAIVSVEDLSGAFAEHLDGYLAALRQTHRAAIVSAYGQACFDDVEAGITRWRDAAAAGKVGRGRFVARR